MDRLAHHLRMAGANGVDRGVVNVNLDKAQDNGASEIRLDTQTDGATKNPNPAPLVTQTKATTSASASAANGPGGGVDVGSGDADNTTLNSVNSSGTAAVTASATGVASVSSVPESSHKSGGGGGIGTGAIVGIVVGVVGGLIVIAIIAFLILRKRRQKKAAGYEGTDTGNTYMVDKETQGRTTDSPNSPYSDENQTRHVPLEDVTRDDPPQERGIPRTSTSGSQGRGGSSGAQTPQGVSSNVAHLVEDGMTADEIRRLEEEERQLDDEIERAARR